MFQCSARLFEGMLRSAISSVSTSRANRSLCSNSDGSRQNRDVKINRSMSPGVTWLRSIRAVSAAQPWYPARSPWWFTISNLHWDSKSSTRRASAPGNSDGSTPVILSLR
uniref:Uncharacterized protein n=1 Tax=uncultured bacterium esnapd15 TaxID=1366595 RepID=S5UCZ0_9BACT|nr:hypothetical protein [uncultured bacterium esnapd15]